MGGSLWRQRIGDDEAVELTHADGRVRLPARRRARRAQRRVHALRRRRPWSCGGSTWRAADAQALTHGGAVNVEPRLSPDGRRIAWVSTQGHGPFQPVHRRHRRRRPAQRATVAGRAHAAALDRYYYSAFDHAINPSWSPDGKTLALRRQSRDRVGHRRHLGRAGRRAGATPQAALAKKPAGAHAPSSRRTASASLFASYHGRQTHQLWLTTRAGRRAVAADLRRDRTPQCALVARRQAHRLHRQRGRGRQHAARS